MFIDKTRIFLEAGRGGNGCASFRREKYVPFGGPNGGSGGKGGDIYLRAEPAVSTLLDFTYKPHFKGYPGMQGTGSDKNGPKGKDLIIAVPCGTVVYTVENIDGTEHKHLLEDLDTAGKIILAANGGKGGRGNASFKTKTNTAPRISEKGEPGENVTIDLELKLIADVGLIGLPNAGKSSLISKITSARPKIADYPFTTLSPNLGVCKHKGRSFVVADIPGLIEGAHGGKGLGTDFLRHIERTSILVHIVDAGNFDGITAFKNYKLINMEIKKYSKILAAKPMIIALNKIDLSDAVKNVKAFKKKLSSSKTKPAVYAISCATGKGIDKLQDSIVEMVSKYAGSKCLVEKTAPRAEIKRYIFEPEFRVIREGGIFTVKGKKAERFVAMTNFQQEEGVRRLQNILKKMGIEKELVKRGIKEGDMVKIGDYEFEFSL